MAGADYAQQLRALSIRFRAALVCAQKERPNRPDFMSETGEFEWAAYERQVMLEQVNKARSGLGLPLATLDDVARVEQQAVGHIDYTAKFALYCAELAVRGLR